jgi:hypothetical protein
VNLLRHLVPRATGREVCVYERKIHKTCRSWSFLRSDGISALHEKDVDHAELPELAEAL